MTAPGGRPAARRRSHRRSLRGAARLAAGLRLAATGAATMAIWWAGRPLGVPPLLDPGRWDTWAAARGPVLATFAAGRLVTVVAGGYLVLLWLTAIVVSAGPAPPAGRPLPQAFRLPGLRWALTALGASVAGLSMTAAAGAATLTGPGSAGPAGGRDAPPVLTYLGPAAPTPSTSVTGIRPALPLSTTTSAPSSTTTPSTAPTTPTAAKPAPTHRALPPRSTVPPTPPGPRRSTRSSPQASVADRPAGSQPAPAGEVVVQPGDCFWSIAVATVRSSGGDPSSVGAVAAYWRQLIRANAGRLPRPGDPDLLFPGDVVVLPPVPPIPG